MKPAALADLPMHSGRRRVITLHPVDAEIVFAVDGTFGINKRQRNEMPAVLMPELQQRKFLEIDCLLPAIRATGAVSDLLCPEISRPPKPDREIPTAFPSDGGSKCLGGLDGAFYKLKRLRSKGKIDPFACSKKICDDGKSGAFDIREKQRPCPSSSITRRWISAISRYGSTSAASRRSRLRGEAGR